MPSTGDDVVQSGSAKYLDLGFGLKLNRAPIYCSPEKCKLILLYSSKDRHQSTAKIFCILQVHDLSSTHAK